MNKNELTEYADYLLQTAIYRVQNIVDAEDLVQETLMAALTAMEQGKSIENPKSFLVTILNRKYYDMLRQKYRKPVVSMEIVPEIPQEDFVSKQIEQIEEAENIRRCLGHLTRLYREVMVRFYMNGESIKQIADALGIPENTVKSRLDTGRKHVRKDFTMDNYVKQSYAPDNLWLCNSGETGINNEPFSLVGNNKIEMNLLILAYDRPVTVPELAKAIGISTTFIEPIVDKLVDGELMKRTADKVYTDFIIYNEEDRTANFMLEKEIADKHGSDMWAVVDSGLSELHEQDFYKAQSMTQGMKLDSFFAVRTMQNAVNNVRNEVCGGISEYPDRSNGGKWYAMGNRYPADYTYNMADYHKYGISGECCTMLIDYCGLKKISLCEYDCLLGTTQQGYGRDSKYIPYCMSGMEVMKMLYAIHTGREEDLPLINMHCFDNMNGFKRMGYLSRSESGKIIVDIPIIEMHDRWKLYGLSEKYDNIISDTFHDELKKLMQNPVKLPSHLKSVPGWQRYMWCCSLLPMLVIENANRNGLFFKDCNLKENPVPAVFLAVEK
ncbi:MAG: RNA polymerase sigma factor [Lachnospiraceae bacterium]|nr:RNA polymerase sigma factor [Lachnospiraceae bacterium]